MKTWIGAALGVLAVSGCGGAAEGPMAPVITVQSGVFEGLVDVSGRTFFPQEDGSDFVLTVDRAAGRVEVRYVKGGATITEFWSIVGE